MTDERQPERTHRRRTRRMWQIAFMAYVVALETATHWPRLDIGDTGPSDKTVHFLAFTVLTILLWRTGWIARLALVLPIALAWAAIDEYSQGIEFLHRSVSWTDLVGNVLGVLLAVVWIWALRPVGGTGNRLRLARQHFVMDEIFAQWKAWVILIGVTIGCAVPLVLLWPILRSVSVEGPLLFAALIWGLAMGLIWRDIWHRHHGAAIEEKACFACGASCAGASFDELGRAKCGSCGGRINVGQWIVYPRPTLRTMARLAIRPAVVALILIAAVFAFIVLVAHAYDRLMAAGVLPAGVPRLVRLIGQERALMEAVDLAALFIAFAIATRLFRGGLARYYDQPFACRKCGHDLRGTPTSGGLGRCGECGHEFARTPEMAGAGYEAK